MVEAAVSQQGIIHIQLSVLILAPNPTTVRGERTSLCITQDGKWLAYPSQSNFVIRNVADPTKADVFSGFDCKVKSVSVSSKGVFAVGDENGRVKLIEYKPDEAEKFVVKKEHNMLGQAVRETVWTEDGVRLAAVGDGRDFYMKVIMAESGTKMGDISGPTLNAHSADMKKIDKTTYLAVCGADNSTYIYQGPPFKFVKSLRDHANFANRVKFSPDGTLLASCSSDKKVILYSTETFEKVKEIEKLHSKGINDLGWIEDTLQFATASSDNKVLIVDSTSGDIIKTLLVSEEEEKLENQQLGLFINKENIYSVTLDSNIHIWNGKDSTTPSLNIVGHSQIPQAVAAVGTSIVSCDFEGRVLSWSPSGVGHEIQSSTKHTSICKFLIPCKNGKSFYSAGQDNMLKLYTQIEEGVFKESNSIKLEGTPLSTSASQVNDQGVYVLLHNNQLAEVIDDKVVKQTEIKFEATVIAATKTELWIGDKLGSLHVHSITDMSEVAMIEKKHTQAVTSLAVSPDSKLVASGDNYRYIYVIKTDSREDAARFTYHSGRVIQLAFSPDSSRLATGGIDQDVGVGEIATSSHRLIEKPNQKELTGVCFSSDGKVVTCGNDCAVRVWTA